MKVKAKSRTLGEHIAYHVGRLTRSSLAFAVCAVVVALLWFGWFPDLRAPGAVPKRFVTGLENNWSYIGNRGDTFYWVTNVGAPRLRIVATDTGSVRDFQAFAKQTGNALLAHTHINGEFTFWLRRK